MTEPTLTTVESAAPQPPALTHQQAAWLFRRPFAPGAIGFRAMSKVAHHGHPHGGAQVAAYLSAQSVLARLNAVVPGRWRQEFHPLTAHPPSDGGRAARKLYLACRLIITLPLGPDGPDVEAVYEDVGELDSGSLAGLKALYSDARKRAAVAAGIGAYLYTALTPVVLAIGPGERKVQCVRRTGGRSDLLTLSPATEQWLRHGYQQRISSPAVLRDLGPILAHGEPETGMGQGEAAEAASQGAPTEPAAPNTAAAKANGAHELVTVDFGPGGPRPPQAA